MAAINQWTTAKSRLQNDLLPFTLCKGLNLHFADRQHFLSRIDCFASRIILHLEQQSKFTLLPRDLEIQYANNMKLSVASLVALVASSVATVSAIDDTLLCYKVSKVDDEGNTKTIFTNDPSKHYEYIDLGYVDELTVSPDNCQTCDLAPPCDEPTDGRDVDCDAEVDEHSDAEGNPTATYTTRECEEEYPKIKVAHCKYAQKIDGNELLYEFENTEKEEDAPSPRQRNLRGAMGVAATVSRVLASPWEKEEISGKCPAVCPSELEIEVDVDGDGITESITYIPHPDPNLSICDNEGCDCLLCDSVIGCNDEPDEDKDEEDTEDDGPDAFCVTTEDPEGDVTYQEILSPAVPPPGTANKDIKKGPCMKFANALCKNKTTMTCTENPTGATCTCG